MRDNRMVYCWKCGAQIGEDSSFCPKCGTSFKPSSAMEGKTGFDILATDKPTQDQWAKRVIAYIIDSLLIGAIVSVLVFAAALPPFLLGGGTFPLWWGFWFVGIAPLLILAYFILAEAVYSRTLGKEIMGLRVARKDGKSMDLGTSFLRNISKINLVLLIIDVLAGLAMKGESSQKFSDRYAGTVVETSGSLRIIT